MDKRLTLLFAGHTVLEQIWKRLTYLAEGVTQRVLKRQVERGLVAAVIDETSSGRELLVEVNGQLERAFQEPAGGVFAEVGDVVLLNTTAGRLALGTGGVHFVIAVEGKGTIAEETASPGHIMKLRYTPWQFAVHTVEESSHPMHETLRQADSLDGLPVVICELHSQMPAVVLSLLQTQQAVASHRTAEADTPRRCRIAYVMTDGGALPIAFSRTVQLLMAQGLLVGTVTAGHAYGGDVEAVNLYSALLAAKAVWEADCIVVAIGPGIVGTGTRFGHTGIEVGQAVNAVHALGGDPIVVPRLSFADRRERHYGLSHHTLTALGRVALAPATVPVPKLPEEQAQYVWQQATAAGLPHKHRFVQASGKSLLDALTTFQVPLRTMGRTFAEDPAFFLAAGAAGEWVATGRKKPLRQDYARRLVDPLFIDRN